MESSVSSPAESTVAIGSLQKAIAEPIRVLHVLTRMNVGGVTHQVVTSCEELRRRGYHVEIAAGVCGPREGDWRETAIQKGFLAHKVPHLSNQAGPLDTILSFFELYRMLRSLNPAIVHVHMLKARALGTFASRIAGIP